MTDQHPDPAEQTFHLTVDSYGRLWLNGKLEGISVSIDLGAAQVAFAIMAATMAQEGFEYHPHHWHDVADNDDDEDR
jgi:hypothetical protein